MSSPAVALRTDAGRREDPAATMIMCPRQSWMIRVEVFTGWNSPPMGLLHVRLTPARGGIRADKRKLGKGQPAKFTVEFTGTGDYTFSPGMASLPNGWRAQVRQPAGPVAVGVGHPELTHVRIELVPDWVGVRLLSAAGVPIRGMPAKLVSPGRRDQTMTVEAAGTKFANLAEGDYQVVFPSMEQDMWEKAPDGVTVAAGIVEVDAAGTTVAKAGDTIVRLAAARGVSPVAVWNANAALRAARPDPNLLVAGDQVSIPLPAAIGTAACEFGQMNVFRLRDPWVALDLVLRDGWGRPLARADYRLEAAGQTANGQTDDKGRLFEAVPATTATAQLTAFPEDAAKRFVWRVEIGRLEPLLDPSGEVVSHPIRAMQSRLHNLGYYSGPVDGAASADLREGILRFQQAAGLPLTGKSDAETCRLLEQFHNSL